MEFKIIGITTLVAGGLIYNMTHSDLPIYKPRPKLNPCDVSWARSNFEELLKKPIITCDEALGATRRAGIIYIRSFTHYCNDPAYMNLHEALVDEHSKNREFLKNNGQNPDLDLAVDVVTSPGYLLYNDYGLRIKRPRVSYGEAHVKDLIKDYIEHSLS